jgi:hypothetical protein
VSPTVDCTLWPSVKPSRSTGTVSKWRVRPDRPQFCPSPLLNSGNRDVPSRCLRNLDQERQHLNQIATSRKSRYTWPRLLLYFSPPLARCCSSSSSLLHPNATLYPVLLLTLVIILYIPCLEIDHSPHSARAPRDSFARLPVHQSTSASQAHGSNWQPGPTAGGSALAALSTLLR